MKHCVYAFPFTRNKCRKLRRNCGRRERIMRLATQPLRKFSHNSGGKIRTEFFNTQLDARRNCIPLAPGLLRRGSTTLSQPLCLCWDWLGGPDRTASSRCDQVIGPGWQRTSGTLRNLQPHAVASADDRSRAQISHVHVGSSLCVVEQVPAEMVGTLVDGIVIATVPAPVRTVGPVPSRHFKEKSAR
jgi:hypothetical protein